MAIPEASKPEQSKPADAPSAAPAARAEQTDAGKPTPSATPPAARRKGPWKRIIAIIVLVIAVILGVPRVRKSLDTVSTDDAYVNGHVTFVAPRVAGQVAHVFVDDNNRVHQGDLLVQLDRGPLQAQVNIAKSAVAAAQADLVSVEAQTRSLEGQARSLRFNLEHAIEDVDNQVALLHAKVATLASERATLDKARAEYQRALASVSTGAVSTEEMDVYKEAFLVAQAKVEEALQGVYQQRVSLGLPAKPETGDDLTQVPADLDQTFSSVRQAQAGLIQAAAQLGYSASFNKTPKEMVADFYKHFSTGDIDVIYAELLKSAPAVKQAEAKLAEAQSDLDLANLNLSYCNVVAEIDGVITRRDVNPGDNVVVGQSVMAIRSLTDIWVDANFKETQLVKLRIGQRVDLDVDMYGRHHLFTGRISGFTMGTGSTLALLPAENATGNFVKVVQRLPVRIDLVDYDPDKLPLFIGLSVTPTVYVNEAPTGPDAGKVLQPYLPTATAPATVPSTGPETRP